MRRQELIAKANEALAKEFEIEISDIVPDADIKETLDLDSLGLVDMVVLIEETFGVKIKDQKITSIKSFESLYDFIEEKFETSE
jgi:acyl carrier protein